MTDLKDILRKEHLSLSRNFPILKKLENFESFRINGRSTLALQKILVLLGQDKITAHYEAKISNEIIYGALDDILDMDKISGYSESKNGYKRLKKKYAWQGKTLDLTLDVYI